MDQYLRNVKVIEDAFDQIKQATGISNIEEIVTTFIKAEEQNYSLFNYVNMLSADYIFLKGEMDANVPMITEGEKQQFDALHNRWMSLKNEHQNLMNTELASFNKLCKTLNLEKIILP